MDRDILRTEIQRLIEENRLNYCLECGKCSAICPMNQFYEGLEYRYSPRGVIEKVLFNPESVYDNEDIWFCLACNRCTEKCPCGIDFHSFMTSLRTLLISNGFDKYGHFCYRCKSYIMPKTEYETLIQGDKGRILMPLLQLCDRCKKEGFIESLYIYSSWPKKNKRRGEGT